MSPLNRIIPAAACQRRISLRLLSRYACCSRTASAPTSATNRDSQLSVSWPEARYDPIPGEITDEKLDILRAADTVYLDEIRNHGLYDEIGSSRFRCRKTFAGGWAMPGLYDSRLCLAGGDLNRRDDGVKAYPFEHAFLNRVSPAWRMRSKVSTVWSMTLPCKPSGTIDNDETSTRVFMSWFPLFHG